MENFVTFEIAKKLKEKGFPQDIQHCIGWYPTEYYKNACIGEYFEGELQEIEDYFADRISAIHITENEKKGVIAPTIAQVLKWLFDEKQLFVNIDCNICDKFGLFFTIYKKGEETWEACGFDDNYYNKPEEATLAGIEYVLDNLI